MNNFPSCFRRGPEGGKPANRRSPLGLFPGQRPGRRLRNQEGIMLIRIRRRDNKYQEMQMVEPEGIVAAACADPTAYYKGRKSAFRISCGSI